MDTLCVATDERRPRPAAPLEAGADEPVAASAVLCFFAIALAVVAGRRIVVGDTVRVVVRTIATKVWSAVAVVLLVETRNLQFEKFGRLFVGAGCPGARQLNSDCGLSPMNGRNARLRSVEVNVATPCTSAIAGDGGAPEIAVHGRRPGLRRRRDAVALLDVDERIRPRSRLRRP